MFVLDASIALEWVLPGQSTAVAEKAYRMARKSPVVVPGLWLLETQNALLKYVRQKKLMMAEALEIRVELQLLSKRIDRISNTDVVDRIWTIASDHMMTVYDATYVELAWRLELPLASNDGAIRAAAKALGVALV